MATTISSAITVKTTMLVLLLAASIVTLEVGAIGGEIHLDWMLPSVRTACSACDGTIGECIAEEDEEMIDSEANRRILAYKGRYISYGALKRDYIPCSRRGTSYYNCRPGAAVNPYHRGCSRITRCQRDTG